MSLINDALKKANQTPVSTTPAPTKEPLHVATHTPAPRWPMFVVPPLVAVVFAAGTFLVVRGWDGDRRVSAKETREAPQVAAETSVAPQTRTPAAIAPVAVATETNAVAAPTFPTLKLQGLIWHPQRPSVVLNGKSLFVGEKIEQAIVKSITPDSVTIVWRGEQRVLTLQ